MKELEELKHMETTLIPSVKKKNKEPAKEHISFLEVLLRAVGALAARAVPLSGVAPFGVAFLAMERRFSVQSLISLVMVTVGYLTLHEWTMLRYIGACLAYNGFLFFLDKKENISLKAAAVAAVVIMALSDIIGMLWIGFSVSGLLVMLFDLALTALGALVFDHCRTLLEGKSIITHMPTTEEKRSVCIMAGIVLLGFQSIPLPIEFSVGNVLGYLILGMVAVSGGLLSGVIFGLAVGALLGLQGELLSYTAVFGICGLVCGYCSRFGKYKTAAALALSGMLLSAYANGIGSELLRIYEVPAAAVILALIPNRVYAAARRFTDFGFEMVEADNPYKKHIQSRLEMTAASFQNLSETFVRLSDKKNQADMQDIAALFDTAADRVCRKCTKVRDCWQKNFNATYKTMFKFLEIMERKGVLEERDVDSGFAGQCICLDSLIKEVNRLFEIYKINQIWKDKLYENREMAGEQFSGVAAILNQMAEELNADASFDNLASEEIRCRLADKGINAAAIQVMLNDHRRSVRLCIKKDEKQELIPNVLKNVLGASFTLSHSPVEDKNGDINLQYNEAPGMRITAGYSCTEKAEECGDAHMLNLLQGGKFLATISDGMGTGHKASLESNAIVTLLENFMDAGFDKTVAVKLINSVMVMKSAGEAFATVDMCMIDLYTGEAEFIKNGAEPSYIKRKENTETVRAASLPVGVISDVEIESFAHKLCCGDTVIMVSDGLEIRTGHEGWLRKSIENTDPAMPVQELADYIMEKSVTLKGGAADDDMTVLVLRLMPQ